MALTPSLTPVLPRELAALYNYLVQRDQGAPSAGLEAGALSSSSVSGLELDRITWGYSAGPAIDRREPDGFLVWWQAGITTDPVDGGVLVAATARAFSMHWPAGVARSYAVAPYRMTYQGPFAGPKVQDATWRVEA